MQSGFVAFSAFRDFESQAWKVISDVSPCRYLSATPRQNDDLKDWAGKTLPALKHHLEMAQGLEKSQ
jgi:hypothetical protein